MEDPNPRSGSVSRITSDESSEGEEAKEKKNGPTAPATARALDSATDHSPGSAKAVATSSCTTSSERGSLGSGKAASAAAASSAGLKKSPTRAVDPERAEAVRFVASFMHTLSQGVRKGKDNKEKIRKRKERKRQINRASAMRKRVRAKKELEDLANKCKDLESTIKELKSVNLELCLCVSDEMEKRTRYIAQIEHLMANMQAPPTAASIPAPEPAPVSSSSSSSAPPVLDSGNLPQSLIISLSQTSDTGQMLQEYMQVERARQDILAQQRQQEQMAQQQQQLLEVLLACLLVGGTAGASAPQPAPASPAPPVAPTATNNQQQDIASQLQSFLLALSALPGPS